MHAKKIGGGNLRNAYKRSPQTWIEFSIWFKSGVLVIRIARNLTGPFFVFVICSFTLSATAEKYTLLFDGTNLDGWKQSGNWKIQKDQSVHRVGPGN